MRIPLSYDTVCSILFLQTFNPNDRLSPPKALFSYRPDMPSFHSTPLHATLRRRDFSSFFRTEDTIPRMPHRSPPSAAPGQPPRYGNARKSQACTENHKPESRLLPADIPPDAAPFPKTQPEHFSIRAAIRLISIWI